MNIFQTQYKIDSIIAGVKCKCAIRKSLDGSSGMNQDSGKQAVLHRSKVASVGWRMQGGRAGPGLDQRTMGSVGTRQCAAEPRGGKLCHATLSHAVLGHNGPARAILDCAVPCHAALACPTPEQAILSCDRSCHTGTCWAILG